MGQKMLHTLAEIFSTRFHMDLFAPYGEHVCDTNHGRFSPSRMLRRIIGLPGRSNCLGRIRGLLL